MKVSTFGGTNAPSKMISMLLATLTLAIQPLLIPFSNDGVSYPSYHLSTADIVENGQPLITTWITSYKAQSMKSGNTDAIKQV